MWNPVPVDFSGSRGCLCEWGVYCPACEQSACERCNRSVERQDDLHFCQECGQDCCCGCLPLRDPSNLASGNGQCLDCRQVGLFE